MRPGNSAKCTRINGLWFASGTEEIVSDALSVSATKCQLFQFTQALTFVTGKYLHTPSCYYSHIFFCWVSSAVPADENYKALQLVNVLPAPSPRKHSRHADRLYTCGFTQVKQAVSALRSFLTILAAVPVSLWGETQAILTADLCTVWSASAIYQQPSQK